MAPVSSLAIGRLESASRVPYARIERMTRPLKESGRWPHRDAPDLSSAHLAHLIAAFAAPLPSDALRAAELAEKLIFREPEPMALVGQSLHRCLASMIDRFSTVEQETRNALTTGFEATERAFIINHDRPEAWVAPPKRKRLARNIIYSIILTDQHNASGIMELATSNRLLSWYIPSGPQKRGVEHLTTIPFTLLIAAGAIYAEARERADRARPRRSLSTQRRDQLQ